MEQGEAQSPQAVPVDHVFEDEDGNVCIVTYADSSDVTYMPMVPVEATEEVVLCDASQEEVKIELDEGYTIIYPEGYTEEDITTVVKTKPKKSTRRGQHQCKICNKTFSQVKLHGLYINRVIGLKIVYYSFTSFDLYA